MEGRYPDYAKTFDLDKAAESLCFVGMLTPVVEALSAVGRGWSRVAFVSATRETSPESLRRLCLSKPGLAHLRVSRRLVLKAREGLIDPSEWGFCFRSLVGDQAEMGALTFTDLQGLSYRLYVFADEGERRGNSHFRRCWHTLLQESGFAVCDFGYQGGALFTTLMRSLRLSE